MYGMYGLGDLGVAPCPSADQLIGVVNPNDPCQAAETGSSASSDYQTVSTPQGDYQIINGVIFDPNGKRVSGIPGGGGLNLSPNIAIWGLVAVAVLMIISSGGGRRK